LEQAGLVSRTRSTDDERSVIVALTDEGRALKGRARSVPGKVERATCLTGQQMDVLKGSLGQLRERLLEMV
jgi:DNA-binding MarR family transcriptional regulator